jgi:hypothetical protein
MPLHVWNQTVASLPGISPAVSSGCLAAGDAKQVAMGRKGGFCLCQQLTGFTMGQWISGRDGFVWKETDPWITFSMKVDTGYVEGSVACLLAPASFER